MKTKFRLLGILLSGLLSTPFARAAEGPHPLSFGLQIGGNAFLYSLNADYDIDENWRAGLGFSYIKQANFLFFEFRDYKAVPLHVDYTFYRRTSNGFYVSSGLTYLGGKIRGGAFVDEMFGKNSDIDQNAFRGFLIPIGVGWEYRGSQGFNFRLSTYGGPLILTSKTDSKTDATFLAPYVVSVYFGWAI